MRKRDQSEKAEAEVLYLAKGLPTECKRLLYALATEGQADQQALAAYHEKHKTEEGTGAW